MTESRGTIGRTGSPTNQASDQPARHPSTSARLLARSLVSSQKSCRVIGRQSDMPSERFGSFDQTVCWVCLAPIYSSVQRRAPWLRGSDEWNPTKQNQPRPLNVYINKPCAHTRSGRAVGHCPHADRFEVLGSFVEIGISELFSGRTRRRQEKILYI